MRELKKSEIRRILIIKWSALGDVALATAAIEDLRLAFPQAVMHLDTLPSARRLFATDPRFDAVFAFPLRDRKRRLRVHARWLRRVRAARYDLVVDLQSSDHTRILLACLAFGRSKVPHRWGIRRGFPYTLTPPVDADPHPAQRMRKLLALAGITALTPRPVLHPSAAQRARVAALLREHGVERGRYAVLLPGSQSDGWLKRWGVERYAALGLMLHRRGVDRILVIGGQAEAVDCAHIVAAIDAQALGVAIHLATLELLEIIPACESAACVIANDTGTAHVAAAAGRPLWVLCGPTDPRRVRPLGAHAVQPVHHCLNCYRKTCRWAPEPQCLGLIEPAAVLALALGDAGAVAGLRVFADDNPAGSLLQARELDIRPILRRGGEPFETIMTTIDALEPGQPLRLLAPFEPVPLFHVLGSRGYTHEAHELPDGDWEIVFSRVACQLVAEAATSDPGQRQA